MKILFLGDSITEGACATSQENIYVNQVAKLLNCEALNYGVSGTRIAKQANIQKDLPDYGPDFLERAKKMPIECDYVFVFGGTNDFGHGDAPIGDFNSREQATFFGALHNLFNYLIKTYGKDKIIVMTPLHRYDEDSPYGEFGNRKLIPSLDLAGYNSIIKEVSNYYNLKILDIREMMPEPISNTPEEYYQDGLHPNDKGHELLAKIIADYIKNL